MARTKASAVKSFVSDSFTNFLAKIGIGTNNISTGAGYSFNFLTRLRIQLEAAYRGSWLVGAAVDMPAEDMTRAGIDFETTLPPEDIAVMQAGLLDLQVWKRIEDLIRWSRLFGGAIGVILIDGQDPKTPLRLETIKKDQFKGLLVLDRWQLQPALGQLVTDLGPDLGLPKFYSIVADAQAMPGMKVHYTRVIRMEGIELPYYQRLAENLWGESVIERIHDRLVAFDSATVGAGQLVYKAHLRTYKVENLRDIIAAGGKALDGLVKQIQMMRLYQSNEGITLMDAKDEFEAHQYTFTGLDSVLIQFGQQISGALQVPLVRLFGQSPAGLNSTGESDLRTYYDHINKQQESKLRRPLNVVLDVLARSKLGRPLPPGFTYTFRSLWQNTETEKADIGNKVTSSVTQAYESGLISQQTALKELRQGSHASGLWSNITNEDIEAADDTVPTMEEAVKMAQGVTEEDGDEDGSGEDKDKPKDDKP